MSSRLFDKILAVGPGALVNAVYGRAASVSWTAELSDPESVGFPTGWMEEFDGSPLGLIEITVPFDGEWPLDGQSLWRPQDSRRGSARQNPGRRATDRGRGRSAMVVIRSLEAMVRHRAQVRLHRPVDARVITTHTGQGLTFVVLVAFTYKVVMNYARVGKDIRLLVKDLKRARGRIVLSTRHYARTQQNTSAPPGGSDSERSGPSGPNVERGPAIPSEPQADSTEG